MNRVDATFERLRQEGRKAFMPFVTAGDPTLEVTAAVLRELERRGAADLVELGLPYSDPLADGPVIQASYQRALGAGVTPGASLDMLKRLRDEGLTLPVCLMVSYSLVYRAGVEGFVERAAAAGADGLIVPDLPVEEAEEMGRAAARRGLKQVRLVTPTTPPDRRRIILAHATGFVYGVSLTGITGERTELPEDLVAYVRDVKKTARAPVCVGFGISRPDQVAAVGREADGVIVGSALVHRMADVADRSPESIAAAAADFCQELSSPLRAA